MGAVEHDPPEEPEYAVLAEESIPMRAHWIAGALEEAGISTHVYERNLSDEFAVSQRALGLAGTCVIVPRERLEEAREILRDLRPPPLPEGPDDEEDGGDEEPEDERAPLTLLSAGVVVLVVALLLGGVIFVAHSCAPHDDGSAGEQRHPQTPLPPARPLPPILHR
jgi:hypothetical protein